jgi:hypothetical protein
MAPVPPATAATAAAANTGALVIAGGAAQPAHGRHPALGFLAESNTSAQVDRLMAGSSVVGGRAAHYKAVERARTRAHARCTKTPVNAGQFAHVLLWRA